MLKRGFIGKIVLVIIAIILLKVWFDFDLLSWLQTEKVANFFYGVGEFLVYIWNSYLKEFFKTLFQAIKNPSA